mgnify:CR=1 FL=1
MIAIKRSDFFYAFMLCALCLVCSSCGNGRTEKQTEATQSAFDDPDDPRSRIITDSFRAIADTIIVHSDNNSFMAKEIVVCSAETKGVRVYGAKTIKIDERVFVCGITDDCINECAKTYSLGVDCECENGRVKITIPTSNGGNVTMWSNVEINTNDNSVVATLMCAQDSDTTGCIKIK